MVKRIVCACVLAIVAGCNAVAGIEPAENADDLSASTDDPTEESSAATPADRPPARDAGSSTTPASIECGATAKLCDGRCVATSDPFFGCRDTSCTPCNVPHARATCAGSACVVSACTPGFADCNAAAADGCETDLSTAAHCGACNAKCQAAAPFCVPGSGGFGCGTGCTASAPTLCGTSCTDTTTDLRNCGRCGNACPKPANATPTCNGTCGFVCSAGTADCDKSAANGCEVRLLTDALNCGACGVACVAPATCVAGACK
jgi:hypothetical protein